MGKLVLRDRGTPYLVILFSRLGLEVFLCQLVEKLRDVLVSFVRVFSHLCANAFWGEVSDSSVLKTRLGIKHIQSNVFGMSLFRVFSDLWANTFTQTAAGYRNWIFFFGVY